MYKCELCDSVWFEERNFRRHQNFYHDGLPMKEIMLVFDTKPTIFLQWVLDAKAKGKPVIYTCVICRINFLKETQMQEHVKEHHNELILQGGTTMTTTERESHISMTFRRKAYFLLPMEQQRSKEDIYDEIDPDYLYTCLPPVNA